MAPLEGQENTANIDTKAAIQAAGGGTLLLAIAMLEDSHLEARPHADYPFGDKYPDGAPKTGDAANFGIYKMNWFMIRQCLSVKPIIGSQPAAFAWRAAGNRINGDPKLATRVILEAMSKWSSSAPSATGASAGNFWAGHRWGESGLRALPGTDWKDIDAYYRSVQTIKRKCDADETVWTTAIRYWVRLPPV